LLPSSVCILPVPEYSFNSLVWEFLFASKPLYESLTDQKIELIDYVNMVLAVVLGSVLIAFTLSITFGIDKVVKGILALPFLGLGIALLVIAGIFLYIRKQKKNKR